MTAYQRARQAAKMKRLIRRWHDHGWVYQNFWIPLQLKDQINAKAAQLGMTKQIIGTAAVVTGLRMMTTSDIVREQRRWREKVKPAAMTKFKKGQPGGPRDPLTGQILRRCHHADSR